MANESEDALDRLAKGSYLLMLASLGLLAAVMVVKPDADLAPLLSLGILSSILPAVISFIRHRIHAAAENERIMRLKEERRQERLAQQEQLNAQLQEEYQQGKAAGAEELKRRQDEKEKVAAQWATHEAARDSSENGQ